MNTFEQKLNNRRRLNYRLIKKPQFSVIIPCYNLGAYIRQAVNSVLAQTLDNIEIIVVDDASSDPDTLKALERLPLSVEVIRHKWNSNVATARNTGIQVTRAPYVLCLDADDWIDSTYLEKAFSIFESNYNVGIVGSWMQMFEHAKDIWKPNFDKENIYELMLSSPTHTASCFRRATCDSTNGYDIDMDGFEDWEHWINIIKHGWELAIIPEVLFHYRVRKISKVKCSYENSSDLVHHILDKHDELFSGHLRMAYCKLYCTYVNHLFEKQTQE